MQQITRVYWSLLIWSPHPRPKTLSRKIPMASADGTSMLCRSQNQDHRITISCETRKVAPFWPGASESRHLLGGLEFPGNSFGTKNFRTNFWCKLEAMHAASGPINMQRRQRSPNEFARDAVATYWDRRQHLTGFGLWRQLAHASNKGIFQDLSGKLSLWRLGAFCIDSRWYVSAIFVLKFHQATFPWNFWKFPSWWFQPIWKICQSKWVHLPSSRDENKKYLSCHHPVRNHHPVSLMKNHHLGWPRLWFFHAQIWSSHTEASRPFDFSSQRTGFHLSSQGWVCWLMNSFIELIYSFIYLLIHWLIYVLIYWLIDWLVGWLIDWLFDWLFEVASSAASLWANVLVESLFGPTVNETMTLGGRHPNNQKKRLKMCNRPKKKGNQLEKVEVCAATFMYINKYIYIYIHILYIFPWKEKMARSWILPKYNVYNK